jgi:pectate lyase
MKLIVNGVIVNATLGFPRTSGSTVFANTMATVNLLAGNNTIRIESISGTATADIDWMEVTGNSPAVGNCTIAKTPTALNNPNTADNILFPNPIKGQNAFLKFNIDKAQKIKIIIANAEGTTIKSINKFYSTTEVNETISTNGIKPGVYYLRIFGENGIIFSKKWVVM